MSSNSCKVLIVAQLSGDCVKYQLSMYCNPHLKYHSIVIVDVCSSVSCEVFLRRESTGRKISN